MGKHEKSRVQWCIDLQKKYVYRLTNLIAFIVGEHNRNKKKTLYSISTRM